MDNIKGSYQMMCRAINGGWAAMAQALSTSVTSLQNSVYCRKGQQMSVARAMAMQTASGTTYFAEALARDSGGVFIALPPANEFGNVDIQEKYVELLDRVGALAREYREATADHKVDRTERRTLEKLGNNICQLVTQINQMTFRIYCKQES
ncbi:hypothetical protein JW897_17860 [Chromobacterium alkanivorans]|nr:hypothetical protein [Chromobacterium alkanivorans]